MVIFKSGNSKIGLNPPRIRIEKVAAPKQSPASSAMREGSHATPRAPPDPSMAAKRLPPHATPTSRTGASPCRVLPPNGRSQSLKRKASDVTASRRSPAVGDRVEFGAISDDDNEDDEDRDAWLTMLQSKKRRREDTKERDPERVMIDRKAYEKREDGIRRSPKFIHAAELASLELNCVPIWGAAAQDVKIKLQYPSLQRRERFELVEGKDKINAVDTSVQIVRHVAETYLGEEEARPFTDPHTGIIRQLEKACNLSDLHAFKTALDKYNQTLLPLVEAGIIQRILSARHSLPLSLVEFILTQVYDRTVAPRVELLAKYENGSDNVYGELMHPFASEILVGHLRMMSGQVFVDLGSGVGNVVLQAALEIGCESWGCEMMENACNLAEAQLTEFLARCQLWGLKPGSVRLERGDFRKNVKILDVLKRADVVLVNNQAFTSGLNDDLVRMFLDLRPGCKIISLKTFVRSATHSVNDVGSTILDVEELSYPEGQGYVSWTNAGGQYCISTRR